MAVKHEITTDGTTVWVNGLYGLLGRFSPRGMDIHGDPRKEIHCLDCGPLPENPWEHFVKGMVEHHKINVPTKYKPSWCK